MDRMENVVEQADVILFHNSFAWKQLFKGLNVFFFSCEKEDIVTSNLSSTLQ